MPFIAEWAKNYALEWLKDKIGGFLSEMVKSQRQDIAVMEDSAVPLWTYLPEGLRERFLNQAYPYAATILSLTPDEVTDIVMECLNENGLNVKREWVKLNLIAFWEELQSTL